MIYRVFLLFGNGFNSIAWLHFTSDFDDRTLHVIVRWCAIDWGVYHNYVISTCGAISQHVNVVFFRKHIFRKIELKFAIFQFPYEASYDTNHCSNRSQISKEVWKHKKVKFTKIWNISTLINNLFTAKTWKIAYFPRK